MKKTKLLFTGLIALLGFNSIAQEVDRCGTNVYMEERMQNEEYARQHNEIQARFIENLDLQKSSRRNEETLIIPVAVHFPTGSESNRDCLVELAEKQMEILNNDFNGTNADISNWDNVEDNYPNSSTGSANVRFVLATENHPNLDPDLEEGDPAVTIGYNFGNGGDSDTNWAGYLNFLVKPINAGLLGYSPLGGNPLQGDAIVMNTFAFGDNTVGCGQFTSSAPFNLGRTVTHELGHHFNLAHIWGNQGGCSNDDGISDTPSASSATYGCPSVVNQCGSINMTMNFMDYSNDACMYMFSEGQTDVMRSYIETVLSYYEEDKIDPQVIEDIKNENNVSVNEFSSELAFDLYPNPAADHLYIKMNNEIISENITVQMFDITGKMVFELGVNGKVEEIVNTSSLKNGMYFVKVFAGDKYYADKVMISK
ncbi:zinc-dependent metalloprotease [Aureivirga sp. CE67]|uniref:zinc-dependent metalloprotease n=1 Tax=Aureivirga sp. CE67 TaxID=1788983 RepID=UPI001E300C38|nr:zinc-dependent metalloprotease [Aureivirga sp. CE67]